MAISVLVADDHEVVRTGLRSIFKQSDIEVVAETGSAQEAVKLAHRLSPDVVLMDIRLGEDDGFVALERIRERDPDVRVVMLSTYDNPTYVARCVALGAHDYVLKGASREQLIKSVQQAAEGNGPADGSLMARVRSEMERRGDRSERQSLPITMRETQVLRHIALGLGNRDIARSLGISVETVKEHVQNILRKINVVDRTQAAVWAVKNGLVRGVMDHPPTS